MKLEMLTEVVVLVSIVDLVAAVAAGAKLLLCESTTGMPPGQAVTTIWV